MTSTFSLDDVVVHKIYCFDLDLFCKVTKNFLHFVPGLDSNTLTKYNFNSINNLKNNSFNWTSIISSGVICATFWTLEDI